MQEACTLLRMQTASEGICVGIRWNLFCFNAPAGPSWRRCQCADKSLHKMTVAQARKEMEAVGLRWQETHDFLPYQHFVVFVKP